MKGSNAVGSFLWEAGTEDNSFSFVQFFGFDSFIIYGF